MRSRRSSDRTERGQSEVVGYVIVFSVVLLSTSALVVFGVAALEDVQSATVADNAEYGMRTVASDLEALYYGAATSRTTELSLDSASLETGEKTVVNVTGRVRGSDRKETINRSFRPIVYATDSADIAYENTLVVRDQRDGAVAVNEPLFDLSADRTVAPVVGTNASTVQSIAGGTRQIRSVLVGGNGTTMAPPDSDPVVVNVTVRTTADRAPVWGRTFNESLAGVNRSGSSDPACGTHGPAVINCKYETDELLVSNVTVDYEFE